MTDVSTTPLSDTEDRERKHLPAWVQLREGLTCSELSDALLERLAQVRGIIALFSDIEHWDRDQYNGAIWCAENMLSELHFLANEFWEQHKIELQKDSALD